MNSHKIIELNVLADKGNSIMVERWDAKVQKNKEVFRLHKNDHYTCLLLESGQISLILDFREIIVGANTLFISYPGQVQQMTSSAQVAGWYLSFNNKLIEDNVRTTLNQNSAEVISLGLSDNEAQWFARIIGLMMALPALNSYKPCSHQEVEQTLLKAFISQAMLSYTQRKEQVSDHHASRSFRLNKQFRQLLRDNFKTLKRPSDYANLLNVSVSYLNDMVKSVTGHPVSHIIREEIIWEAQRLLYYTDLSIKEIAFSLGYEDQKYFSRLYKKATNVTPGEFRKNSTVFKKTDLLHS